jgi:hypothetical protein
MVSSLISATGEDNLGYPPPRILATGEDYLRGLSHVLPTEEESSDFPLAVPSSRV